MIGCEDFSISRKPDHTLVEELPHDRPLLLVDVDGVLNVFPQRNPKSKTYDVHQVTTSDNLRFRLVFRKDLREMLAALTEVFQPVWCTMWDHEANLSISPLLDLDWWPVIPTYDHAFEYDRTAHRYHHKIPMIEAHVADRPFAFIDDELTGWDNLWQDNRTASLAPTLVHRIDSRSGLLPHNVEKLLRWAARVS